MLDLCLDVIYNQNMKAIGLGHLVALYRQWAAAHKDADDTDDESLMAE